MDYGLLAENEAREEMRVESNNAGVHQARLPLVFCGFVSFFFNHGTHAVSVVRPLSSLTSFRPSPVASI